MRDRNVKKIKHVLFIGVMIICTYILLLGALDAGIPIWSDVLFFVVLFFFLFFVLLDYMRSKTKNKRLIKRKGKNN
ncbi:MAG: hypothetical protein IJ801_10430 [Lachnospiraceae bacterium]|nr:hypothetical protein [Lachnospiraceae bacterium]